MAIYKIGSFILNNDLNDLKLDTHNGFHLVASFLLAFFTNFWISYGVGQAWEVGDGLKPWYTGFTYNPNQSKVVNYLRQNFLYSNGYSYQDAFVWDLAGAILGTLARWILLPLIIL